MSQENPISKQPLIRYVNRQQMSWRAVDVEHLIGEDQPTRTIWALVGRLDLGAFYQAIESSTEEGAGLAIDEHHKRSILIKGRGSAFRWRRCLAEPLLDFTNAQRFSLAISKPSLQHVHA
jgi:hypothetical protein